MSQTVILNEKAGGGGNADLAELRASFARAGIEAEIRAVPAGQIEGVLRGLAQAGADAVYVAGGDGTVRCAAGALAGTRTALGVLPLGTYNHFAKDLRIPTGLDEAVAALAVGEVRTVDLGDVNGHVFINNCSLGGYAEAVRRRDALRAGSSLTKWRAMARASWQVFRHLRRLRLRLTGADGVPRVVRTPLVFIGNNRYDGAVLSQCLRGHLDEGRLWIYVMRVHRRFAVLRLIVRSLFRRLDSAEALDAWAATELVIESESGPIAVAADGEILELTGPLRFRIRPAALRVLVPAGGEGARA